MNKVAVIGLVGKTIFMSVDHFHKKGETIETTNAHYEYGAKGFNQAITAARMGAEVSFLCPVDKENYEDIISLCKKEGIYSILVKKEGNSSFGCVLTDKKGANQVTIFKGINLSPGDILVFEEAIKNADILLLNNEVPEEVNLAAVRLAKRYGTKVILNPAPTRKTCKEILDSVYLFTPNECEADGLENFSNVIQTIGEKGCFIKSKGKILPSIPVKAVDTTGAGDIFNGTLAAYLSRGSTLLTAAEKAIKASGLSVTKRGVISSIPYKKDIEKRLQIIVKGKQEEK